MQPTRRGFTARRIPCRFSSCGRWFKSATGLKTHLRSAHNHDFNRHDDAEQPVPPDVVRISKTLELYSSPQLSTALHSSHSSPRRQSDLLMREYHEKLTGLFSLLVLTVIESYSTGNICDENGKDLPEGTPPLPHTPQDQDDWTLYRNRLKFDTARHFFSKAQTPASEIDNILYLWGLSLVAHQDEPPFADHQDLYETIDSTPIGDAPWKNFGIKYSGSRPTSGDPPLWMDQTYDVWYCDPRAVIKNILSNTDFDGEIDYAPYRDFLEDDSHRYKDFMSGDWAWEQAVSSITSIITVAAVTNSLSRTKLPKILEQMGQLLSPSFLGVTK